MTTPLAKACFCSLLFTSACLAGQSQPCRLKQGLSAERNRLEQEYSAHQQIADRLSAQIKAIDKEYFEFLYTLANLALKNDEKALRACSNLGNRDPIASQLVALVLYLHNGRKDAARFVASFPANKQQLTNFWSLDAISAGGTTEAATSLPGISLPDGLVDKYITELFSLAVNGNPEAMRKYTYLYKSADGDYFEFMEDQAATFFNQHPDIVIREWPLFSSLGKKLAADQAATTGDYPSIATKLRMLCGHRRDQTCSEILKLFQ